MDSRFRTSLQLAASPIRDPITEEPLQNEQTTLTSFLEGTKEITTPHRSQDKNESNAEGAAIPDEPNQDLANLFEREHR